MITSSDHVLVVGAGLAGWRCCEALRREGFEGAITLIGDEPYAPYDRPPLSKQVLSGKWAVDHTTLATPELLSEARVVFRPGVAATHLDVDDTTVHLADGSTLRGTHVVIATGSRARQLPFQASPRLHTVRGRGDVANLLRAIARLDEGATVVVIGGGFIGAEAATALHARGLRPLVLEAMARPLINALGPVVSSWLERLASDAGIELRTDQQIADVVEAVDGLLVRWVDQTEMAADVVIVGAGALTNVEWLATSGLVIDDGVVVDEHLLATPRVGAIGDVARFDWRSTMGHELVRIEHWQVATDHAVALARHWTGGAPAPAMVPYFWSDQYGKKIQMLGHPHPDDEVVRVAGDDDQGRWLALYSRGGIVTGVMALSQPRGLMLSKALLESPTTLDEARSRAPWST